MKFARSWADGICSSNPGEVEKRFDSGAVPRKRSARRSVPNFNARVESLESVDQLAASSRHARDGKGCIADQLSQSGARHLYFCNLPAGMDCAQGAVTVAQ